MKYSLICFLTLFCSFALYSQPSVDKINNLIKEAEEFHNKQNYEISNNYYSEALEIISNLNEAKYNDYLKIIYYGLSRNYSMMNKPEKALEALEMDIISYSDWDFNRFASDEELNNIRDEEKFNEILYHGTRNYREAKGEPEENIYMSAPENYDPQKSYPLIIALHGRGGNPRIFLNTWKPIIDSLKYILACPQGPVEVGNDIYSWDAPSQVNEELLMKVLDTVKKTYNIDSRKIILSGFSQGGYLTYLLGIRHHNFFKGLFPISGYFKITDSRIDIEAAEGSDIRIYAVIGNYDDPAFIESNKNAETILNYYGIKCQLNIYNAVGHSFPDNVIDEFKKALDWIMSKY
jgi:predicted esterase